MVAVANTIVVSIESGPGAAFTITIANANMVMVAFVVTHGIRAPMKSKLHEVIASNPELASSTRAHYLLDLDLFVEFAGTEPSAWSPGVLERFHTSLLTRMTHDSAERLMSSVRTAIRLLEPTEALTPEQAIKLLATCATGSPKDLRDRAIIVTVLETGMKRMTLLGMTCERTFLDAKGSPTGAPTAIAPMQKSRTAGTFALSPTAVAAIQPWRALVTTGFLFRARTGEPLRPLSREGLGKILQARADAAGIGRVNAGVLRASFFAWGSQKATPPWLAAVVAS